MASLRHSRGKFFHRHKMPPSWHLIYFMARTAGWAIDDLDERYPPRTPVRSNSDDFERIVETMISRLPQGWRHHGENLFVGLVPAGTVNAQAWSERQAGLIEIDVQFIVILDSYFLAFEEFKTVLASYASLSAADAEYPDQLVVLDHRLLLAWDKLQERRREWANPSVLADGLISVPFSASEDSREVRQILRGLGELFIVGHELSHHLLGHTRKSGKRTDAADVVSQVLDASDADWLLVPLNKSKQDEIRADVLSYLMVADALQGDPSPISVDVAFTACAIVLMCLAHVGDNWSNEGDTAGSHPSFVTRVNVLAAVARYLCIKIQVPNTPTHPAYSIMFMSIFSGFVANHVGAVEEVPPLRPRVDAVSRLTSIYFKRVAEALKKSPDGWKFPDLEVDWDAELDQFK